VTQAGRFSAANGGPAADGFYLPADTSRQARLWLPWPAGNPALQIALTGVVRAAAAFEPVAILAAPGHDAAIRAACGGNVADIVHIPHVSLRLRDTGPSFLIDGKGGSAAVDWHFNGWGKGGDDADAQLAHALLGAVEVRRFRAPLTLEGSSFVGDGRGTLLALAPAVFDEARNPGLEPLAAFGVFQDWLGATRVIWLPESHPGDRFHTDVRLLAAFVEPGLVAITESADNAALMKTAAHLAGTRDGGGQPLDFVRLPEPPRGSRTLAYPLSYTNFVPVNGGLLVPAFDAPSDARAADILADAFPDRVVQSVPAGVLAESDIPLTSLILPHFARLLERDRATVLPRSAWSQPEAMDALERYSAMVDGKL